MSNEWSEGYVSEIGYTYGFYRELTPNLIHLAALVRGQAAPDPNSNLTYCELGCGQGVSTNVLASANPHIQFYATDFNPSQIAGAKSLAAAAGTQNVHFLDNSFQEMIRRTDLPDFDIIALHGIYSWISAENRKAIVDFIAAKLKVGGVVYISYNTLPGWAAMMPLRRLFVEHAAGSNGPILKRVDQALEAAEALASANARYFLGNPSSKDRLKLIKDQPRSYLAHEYFNRDWTPFYHGDVVDELSSAKLSWIASATIIESVDGFNLTADQQKLLSDAGTTTRREELRDFIVNQQFRRDLFAKGALTLPQQQQTAYWQQTRFVLIAARADMQLKITTPLGELQLSPEIYNPVLDHLAKGVTTGAELMRAVPSLNLGQLVQALLVLCAQGYAHPCLSSNLVDAARRQTERFNSAVMERATQGGEVNYLASPLTGGALTLDRISQMFALAAKTGVDGVNLVWQNMKAANQRFVKDGKALSTEEENLAEARERHAVFSAKLLPLLRELLIV